MSLKLILVSVIMTVYNREKYLSVAIQSVLNQTFSSLELIIIDDFSSDRSTEIIKKYQEKDDRIKFLFHDENKGISKSTNDGINLAKGKFIAFIDSDDVWDKKKLEKQIKLLERDENLIIWTDGEIIDENGKFLGKTFVQLCDSSNKKKSGDIFFELLLGNFINKSSLIFKKKILGDLRFDERLKTHEDYKIAVDLAKNYNYFFINQPLTQIRKHDENTTFSDGKILILDHIKVTKYFLFKYFKYIPKKTRLLLYQTIIISTSKLSKYLTRLPDIYNDLKIDIYHFIYKVKNELEIDRRIGNILLNRQILITYRGLNSLISHFYSFKKFFKGLSLVIRFERISKSLRFWVNFIIFLIKSRKII